MSWAFFSYVLFCNYCFELTVFHMPNSIKLRNWSTWLLLFLFFNSSFCVEMRSGVAFLPLLETSGERSNYSLASIKHLGLRRCGQELITDGIAGSGPYCCGSVFPRQLPARHPAPVEHSLLSLLESVLQKYLLCLLPTGLLKLTASRILTVGLRSQGLGWCFPCCCTRSAKNTVLILQHQGSSEVASELLYVLPLLLESLKIFELFGEVASLSRSLCIDYPLCDK